MRIKRGSIKTRITFITLFVVLLTIFLVGISVRVYFTNIFSKQIIRDNTSIIARINMQIANDVSDIIDYSKIIIQDDQVQDCLKQNNKLEHYWYYSNIHDLENKLKDYVVMRDDIIDSMFIFDLKGNLLSTNNTYGVSSEDSWYRDFIAKEAKWGFSEVHSIKKSQQGREVFVVSFIININSKSGEGDNIGRLVINLKYDAVVSSLLNNDASFGNFLLLDSENNVIFKRFDIEDGIFINAVSLAEDKAEDEPVFYNNCYFITQTIPECGWKLIGVLPNEIITDNLQYINIFLIIIGVACMALMCVLIIPAVNNVTRPLMILIKGMKEVSKGNLETRIEVKSGDEVKLLADVYNKMTEDIKNYIAESVLKEKHRRDLELRLFMNQINPHFIYNTLNTIIYLGRQIEAKDIISVTQAFIRILQYTIRTQPKMVTTVEEEIDYINNYMSILKYRYNDMVRLEWKVDPGTLACRMPKLLVYPLVENSVFHGIFPLGRTGLICITIAAEHKFLRVHVEDDGIGMNEEELLSIRKLIRNKESSGDMEHIGLQNVNGRLQLLYGSRHALEIESTHMKGTRVWFYLPVDYNYEANANQSD